MKQKTNNQSLTANTNSMVAKTSLFDSILGTESQHAIDAEINKYANRVGVILKILYARELNVMRDSFIARLTELVKDTANYIDNELSKTKED